MTLSQRSRRNGAGFTLLEILVVVAIIGIIAAIAIPLYGNYTTRARATDIVTKFDAAKSTANANIADDGVISKCDEVLKRFSAPTISDEYARIAYAFEAVSNGNESGYRPVLTVCSRVASQGAQAVKVARAAHDEFAKNLSIEGGAVLTDTVVSFALPLTDPKRVVCLVPVGGPFTACGDPVAVPTLPAISTPTPQLQAVPTPLPQSTPSITSCPLGQYLVDDPNGAKACYTPPPCANSNDVWYQGDQKCHPRPAASCPAGSVMNWDASTSTPLCISADGNITPLTLPQPPAPTMVCSGGQQLSADGKKCECPSGQSLQNGQCRNTAPVVQQLSVRQQLNTCLANCVSIHAPGQRRHCEENCGKLYRP